MAETATMTAEGEGARRLAALVAVTLTPYPPFATLETAALDFLATHVELRHFPAQTPVLLPEAGPIAHLYIVVRGKVVSRGDAGGAPRPLGPGEMFPLGAAAAGRPAEREFSAAGDCDCYRLEIADFRHLQAISPVFAAYVGTYVAARLQDSRRELQERSAELAAEQQVLHLPLSRIGSRQPLALPPPTPLREALGKMSSRRVGSVAVCDDAGKPLGILTRGDLLDRVLLAGIDLAQPLAAVMTARPLMLDEHATAYDAMLLMSAHNIRHVLVVDGDGRLSGVVSERDLFALQRGGWGRIRHAVAAAADIAALQRCAGEIRALTGQLLEQGVGSRQLTQFISALNDALTRRVIELNLERHDLFGIDWCWLAFGSEGRDEQTCSTDQDNGIIFFRDDFSDRDALKLRLTAFAGDVNRDLDTCGFPLCTGRIMAGNPDWCLTLEEWQERFSDWIATPEPAALLNASIFFDFRPLYGKSELASRLRRHLLQLTADAPLFLRALTVNALDVEPPLGRFRDFRTDLEAGHPGCIDLKKYGSRLFVDAARIYALASGVGASNTVQRLRLATARQKAGAEDIEATIEAFDFIQNLRLRYQLAGDGNSGGNLVMPEALNELDRRILKEAFRQARKLQTRLRLDYLQG